MPQQLSKRVRVRHVSGAEKDVLRSQLDQLGPSWKRVGRNRKAQPPPQVEPSRIDEPAPPPPPADTPPTEE